MLNKIAETIIGGAIGVIALYVVGRVAYQAGQEVAREECRYNAMRRATAKATEKAATDAAEQVEHVEEEPPSAPGEIVPVRVPRKKQSKLGLLFGTRRLFGNRKSVIGNLVQNPEKHKFEAFVEGDELQIHVKQRESP